MRNKHTRQQLGLQFVLRDEWTAPQSAFTPCRLRMGWLACETRVGPDLSGVGLWRRATSQCGKYLGRCCYLVVAADTRDSDANGGGWVRERVGQPLQRRHCDTHARTRHRPAHTHTHTYTHYTHTNTHTHTLHTHTLTVHRQARTPTLTRTHAHPHSTPTHPTPIPTLPASTH